MVSMIELPQSVLLIIINYLGNKLEFLPLEILSIAHKELLFNEKDQLLWKLIAKSRNVTIYINNNTNRQLRSKNSYKKLFLKGYYNHQLQLYEKHDILIAKVRDVFRCTKRDCPKLLDKLITTIIPSCGSDSCDSNGGNNNKRSNSCKLPKNSRSDSAIKSRSDSIWNSSSLSNSFSHSNSSNNSNNFSGKNSFMFGPGDNGANSSANNTSSGNGSSDSNQTMIDNFINPNFDVNYRSKLIEDHSLLTLAARYNKNKCIKLLIEKYHCYLELSDCGGFTALIYSSFWGNYEGVRYLVQAGASLTAKGRERSGPNLTAQHWAILKGNHQIFNYLRTQNQLQHKLKQRKEEEEAKNNKEEREIGRECSEEIMQGLIEEVEQECMADIVHDCTEEIRQQKVTDQLETDEARAVNVPVSSDVEVFDNTTLPFFKDDDYSDDGNSLDDMNHASSIQSLMCNINRSSYSYCGNPPIVIDGNCDTTMSAGYWNTGKYDCGGTCSSFSTVDDEFSNPTVNSTASQKFDLADKTSYVIYKHIPNDAETSDYGSTLYSRHMVDCSITRPVVLVASYSATNSKDTSYNSMNSSSFGKNSYVDHTKKTAAQSVVHRVDSNEKVEKAFDRSASQTNPDWEKQWKNCTYCICGCGFMGKMVGCDNESCTIEWYHFECVGLQEEPIGCWICPLCSGKEFLQPRVKTSYDSIYHTPKRAPAINRKKRKRNSNSTSKRRKVTEGKVIDPLCLNEVQSPSTTIDASVYTDHGTIQNSSLKKNFHHSQSNDDNSDSTKKCSVATEVIDLL